MNHRGNTLGMKERIKSKKQLEALFSGGGSHSMVAFPLRLVYMTTHDTSSTAPMLMVSVSKRHFKHAVDRNRAKRQMREAYRLNKHILAPAMEKMRGKTLSIAFIWLADAPQPTGKVQKSMVNLLTRLSEKEGRERTDEKAGGNVPNEKAGGEATC